MSKLDPFCPVCHSAELVARQQIPAEYMTPVRPLGVSGYVAGMTARGKSAAVVVELPLTAGVIAVPVSVILHSSVVRSMASAGGTELPDS
jgi:hypothetical protein